MLEVDNIKSAQEFCKYISEKATQVKPNKQELRIGDLAFIPSPLNPDKRVPTVAICLDNFHLGMNRFLVCMPLSSNKQGLSVFHTSCGFKHIFCNYNDCYNHLLYSNKTCSGCVHCLSYQFGEKRLYYCNDIYSKVKIPFVSHIVCPKYHSINQSDFVPIDENEMTLKTTLKGILFFDKGIIKLTSSPMNLFNKNDTGIQDSKVSLNSVTLIQMKTGFKTSLHYSGKLKTVTEVMDDIKRISY